MGLTPGTVPAMDAAGGIFCLCRLKQFYAAVYKLQTADLALQKIMLEKRLCAGTLR
jgi:hypothetical protein